jgi:carbamoyltransferase
LIGSALTDVIKYSPEELDFLKVPTNDQQSLYESISVYLHEANHIRCVHKEWITINRPQNYKKDIGLNLSPMSLFESSSVRIFNSVMESGKVMGLAAYGAEDSSLTHENIVLGSYKEQEKLNLNDIDNTQFNHYSNIAKFTQNYFEKYMFDLIKEIKNKNPNFSNISLVGGGSLNCVFNAKLIDENLFDEVYTPAWSNDSGTAIGCAFYDAVSKGKAKIKAVDIDKINPFIGDEDTVDLVTLQSQFEDALVTQPAHLEKVIAELISRGEVISIFKGQSEVGPRALGNRSILASVSKDDVINYLNNNIKYRERYRPYGVIMKDESLGDYFESGTKIKSPFMSFAPRVKQNKTKELQNIIHADNTLRVQTVNKISNSFYTTILDHVYQLTGDKMIINTSLNIKGQPILRTINDCHEFFKNSKIKYFIINNFLVEKK